MRTANAHHQILPTICQDIATIATGMYEQSIFLGGTANRIRGYRPPQGHKRGLDLSSDGADGGNLWAARGRARLRVAASNDALGPHEIQRGETPKAFTRLRHYWNGLRVNGALPHRTDIAPRDIGDILDSTLLVERIAPGIARVRIAGLRLSDVLGMDLRGMPLSALILPSERAAFATEIETIFARPAQAEFWLRSDWGIGRPVLEARLLLLPVVGDVGRVDRALGYLHLSGTIGRAPRRFDLRGVVASPVILASQPPALPHSARPPMGPAPMAGLSEDAGPGPRHPDAADPTGAGAHTVLRQTNSYLRLITTPPRAGTGAD